MLIHFISFKCQHFFHCDYLCIYWKSVSIYNTIKSNKATLKNITWNHGNAVNFFLAKTGSLLQKMCVVLVMSTSVRKTSRDLESHPPKKSESCHRNVNAIKIRNFKRKIEAEDRDSIENLKTELEKLQSSIQPKIDEDHSISSMPVIHTNVSATLQGKGTSEVF